MLRYPAKTVPNIPIRTDAREQLIHLAAFSETAAAAPADGAEEAPADSAGDAPADKPAE